MFVIAGETGLMETPSNGGYIFPESERTLVYGNYAGRSIELDARVPERKRAAFVLTQLPRSCYGRLTTQRIDYGMLNAENVYHGRQ